MKSVKDNSTQVVAQVQAFSQAIKDRLVALEEGVDNAANADFADNAGKLDGLTLNEVVELIAGTVGLTTQEVLDQLTAHTDRVDNPHAVTKEQVGLGLVDNFATATDAEAAGVGYKYVATDGQTAFTGVDEEGATIELDDSAVVYVEKNGNRVGDANYSVDVPSDTITLTNPAASAEFTYTATEGQTEVTGEDDVAAVLAIGSGQKVTVSKNATDLTVGTDFTVDPKTNTVTLTAGATADDTIKVTVSDVVVIRVVTTERFMTPQVLWHVMDAFWGQKVGAAPETLDTIDEIAAAIENNQSAVDSIDDAIATRATKTELQDAVSALEGQLADKADQTALTDLEATLTDQINNIDASSAGLGNVDNFATATQAEGMGITYTYTAGADQTEFSGEDDNTTAMVISDNAFVAAFKDGEKLADADFTVDPATDKITVPGAVETNVLEFVVWAGDKFMTAATTGALFEALRADTAQAMVDMATAFENEAASIAPSPAP